MNELGEQVSADERNRIKSAISTLRDALKSDDKDQIDQKTKALLELSGKLAERIYAAKSQADKAGQAGKASGGGASGGGGQARGEGGGDEVVDAEFEEVKEEGRKK